jgi:saccharopine dehydrogenase-like NADP-dependent oxidoreductase
MLERPEEVLIVGGYGVVGQRVAAEIAPEYQGRVIVAGRSLERAEAAAAKIGHGVLARAIDVDDPTSIAAALRGVSTVLSCIDQRERLLLRAAVERGLRYTDITPHLTELGRGSAYEQLDAAARASGACLVLGTGLVPGISSVMVRALIGRLGGADRIETALLLSAHDLAGPAAFEYFIRELSMPFAIHVDGADRPARTFTAPRLVEFPAPIGSRPAYLFPFSDQVLYPRTTGAQTVLCRLAIEPPSVARLLATLVQIRATSLLAWRPMRETLARLRGRRAPRTGAIFALRVDVLHNGRTGCATLIGAAQADAAAAGAVGVLKFLLDTKTLEPGAWMPEQVIDPEPFFSRLAIRGLRVTIAE